MRVALVNPNRLRPPIAPIALEFLAQALLDAGHEPHVVDLCFATDPQGELGAALGDGGHGLVAITIRNTDDCFMASGESFLPEYVDLVAAAREATQAPVVLGGAGFSATPTGLVRATGADYGVVGDGEGALVMLAAALESGCAPTCRDGLIGRDARGPRAALAACPRYAEEGPLRWAFVDVERYFREGGQAGLETKRGCPMTCIYCADPLSKGTALRLRPPPVVADEMGALAARGVDHFHLCDSEVNVPTSHLAAVCEEIIARGFGESVRWYGYATVAGFDRELAELAVRSGCAGINFGADSGDAGMLRRLGRSYGPEDILTAVAACKSAGLAVMLDLLLGGPGETRESIARTIGLVKHAAPTCAGVSFGLRIYAGTELAALVRRAGPLEATAAARGAVRDNDDLARPVYYVEPGLGDDAERFIAESIAGDKRFFFGGQVEAEADYNYNNNALLEQAIAAGARGAYWHILARLRGT